MRTELEEVKDQKSKLEEEKKVEKMVGGLGNYFGKALVQNALDSNQNSKQFLDTFQARMINSDIQGKLAKLLQSDNMKVQFNLCHQEVIIRYHLVYNA